MWRNALQDPAAHSLETWHDDQAIPLTPTLPRGGANGRVDGSLVSWGFLAAMSACKLEDGGLNNTLQPGLAWLPPQLQCLQVKEASSKDWGGCACVPGLKMLDLSFHEEFVPKQLSILFPNLETLEIDTHRDGVPGMWNVFEDIGSNLPHLKNVAIWCQNVLPEFQGPIGCRVIARLEVEVVGEPLEIEIPVCIASQLYSTEIAIYTADNSGFDAEVDLAIFAECQVLSCIVVSLHALDSSVNLRVKGFESLPAACKVVEFKECADDFPFVKLAKGWQVEEFPHCLRMCCVGCLGYGIPPSESDTPEFWPSGFPGPEGRL